ncbi:hypothetical protein Peur_018000 [Populus x canadensis]
MLEDPIIYQAFCLRKWTTEYDTCSWLILICNKNRIVSSDIWRDWICTSVGVCMPTQLFPYSSYTSLATFLSRQGVLFQQIYIKPRFFNGAQNHQQELRNFEAHPDTGYDKHLKLYFMIPKYPIEICEVMLTRIQTLYRQPIESWMTKMSYSHHRLSIT